MSSKNPGVANDLAEDVVLDRPLQPLQVHLLGYQDQLHPVGRLALLAEPELQLHWSPNFRYVVPEDIADQVIDRCGLRSLERQGNGAPATHILGQVSAAKAREIVTTTRSDYVAIHTLPRVAAVGEDHALTPEEATRVLRRAKYDPDAAKQLALKGYRIPIGKLPKYVAQYKRRGAAPWLAALEVDTDRAVEFMRAASRNSDCLSFGASRPHMVDAFLQGAKFPGIMRGLATVVPEDRNKWIRAVEKALPEARGTQSELRPLRSHPYATDSILMAARSKGTVWADAHTGRGWQDAPAGWQDAPARSGELADYVLGRKRTLPQRLVEAAKVYVEDRCYRWEFGGLRTAEWPAHTRPVRIEIRETSRHPREEAPDPIVDYLNANLGGSEEAWGRFVALVVKIGTEVAVRDLVSLSVDG